ncbi:class F sortase [Terracoccus luteus]|uniref:class F sortase n=1 Tax=Terracoccus luteus TaxID=53356 RepID=UPI000EB470F9|nr:class F sortase [Terracoccus luteus]
MSTTGSRGRVVAALSAALLAGSLTAWVTRPAANADGLHGPSLAHPSQAVTSTTTPARGGTAGDSSPAVPPTGDTRADAGSSASPDARVPRGSGTTPLLGRPLAQAPASTAPVPTRFRIDRLGIDMQVLPEGVARDGEMALAPDPADVGWYRYGPRPGDAQGAAVLAAHVDNVGYGVGPLAALHTLRDGDVLTVVSGGQTRRYAVESVDSIEKTTLDLGALFTRSGPPRLHVVTCGGTFDQERRRYDRNVVVVAVPIR